MTKVLIANPAVRRDLGQGLERYFMGSGVRFPWSMVKQHDTNPRFSMFPMFLGYAAALLEKAGIETYVIDGVPIDLDSDTFRQKAVEVGPEIIVFEPNSAVIDDILDHARYLKQKTGATIVLVGSHVSAELHSVFSACPEVDYAVLGEYELGLRDLVISLANGQSVTDLPGVAYRRDIKKTDGPSSTLSGNTAVAAHPPGSNVVKPDTLAPGIENLDDLPYPARHLFPAYFHQDINAYHDGFNQLQPAIDVHATRGCPYRCNFCVWVQVLYDNGKHRPRSPEAIVDEMDYLASRYGAREIYFDDDNFTANKKHVEALCDEIINRGLSIKWSVLADAIALNENMLEKMAAAGCIGIKFGLDSADSDVLRKSNKPLKVSRVAGLVEKAKKLGIKTHMTVVLGLSGETKQSLQRTFEFSCGLDIDSIQFSLATPVPGTRFYEELKAENKLHFVRWEDLDGYSSSVISYEDFSQEYLEQFEYTVHSRWLRARLRHPRWVMRQVRYLIRLTLSQGWPGFKRRLMRGWQLVKGDSIMVGTEQQRTSIRW